jgi:hypothetical protein
MNSRANDLIQLKKKLLEGSAGAGKKKKKGQGQQQ